MKYQVLGINELRRAVPELCIFRNSRGLQSTIYYIVTNKHIHPPQLTDKRNVSSAYVCSDNDKYKIKYTLKKRKETKIRKLI